jgi:hypothetical protein
MNVYAKLTPHMNDFQNIESLNLPQKLTTVYYLAITLSPHVVKAVIQSDFEIKFVINNGRNKFSLLFSGVKTP